MLEIKINEIKIKYLRDVPKLIQKEGSDWIDLYTPFDVILSKFKYTKIPLGIAMELPKGYEAIIAPRSSTFERYGIIQTNGIGIIDEKYCGDNDEWHFPCIELSNDIVCIPKHTRLCQFRLLKHQDLINFIEVEKLNNINRNGFGSTGI